MQGRRRSSAEVNGGQRRLGAGSVASSAMGEHPPTFTGIGMGVRS